MNFLTARRAIAAGVLLAFLGGQSPVAEANRPFYMHSSTHFQDWSDMCVDINEMIASGVTHVILGFLNDGSSQAAIGSWEYMSQKKRDDCLEDVRRSGAQLILAATTQGKSWTESAGKTFGRVAAEKVVELGFHGLELDMRTLPPNFERGTAGDFLIEASKEARKVLNHTNPHALIIHATSPEAFTESAGPNRGYVALLPKMGYNVDFVFIQFYNQGPSCKYEDADTIFHHSECDLLGSAIDEIKEALASNDWLASKLVVSKPVTDLDVYNSGYLAGQELHDILCAAENNDGYRGGVVGWSYRGPGISRDWMRNVAGSVCGEPDWKPTERPTEEPEEVEEEEEIEGCYVNKAGNWYDMDCDSDDICIFNPDITSELSCISAAEVWPTWAMSRYDCRNTHFLRMICGSPPSVNLTPIVDEEVACFVSELYYTPDCWSGQICIEAPEYTNRQACLTSGKPMATWAANHLDCRDKVTSSGGCLPPHRLL